MPCVMFPLVLGNLHEKSFQEIWGASTTRAPASTELWRQLRRLSHRVACAGCRAAAWAHTGDPLAADPAAGIIDPRQRKENAMPHIVVYCPVPLTANASQPASLR